MVDASLALDTGPARVLVVEDEPKLSALLADYLRAAGHEPECVADGRDVLPAWTARHHDLILLDLMLPGLDGLSLCREIRARSSVPIVMLTARADEADRLLGLELGADDYIAKNPFSPREVMARVKAVLRRSRAGMPAQPTEEAVVLPLQIDDAGWRASWQGPGTGPDAHRVPTAAHAGHAARPCLLTRPVAGAAARRRPRRH